MNAALKYDIIETCHDDYEQYIYQEDMDLLKSVHALSLGDLMGEDYGIWIQKNKEFGFDIEIENEDTQTVIREKGIHPYALEGFAQFCRNFLDCYSKFEEQ